MPWTNVAWLVFSAAAATLLTWRARAYALARGVIDVPNERSSHSQPTPRGGGLAIVTTTLVALLVLVAMSAISLEALFALGLGGLSVAIVGYVDDHRPLSALPRIVVHAFAAMLAVVLLSHEARMEPVLTFLPSWMVLCLLAVGIVWSVNLFNFMDGIDGIAASQALFVTSASALLIGWSAASASEWVTLLTASAGACAGFLLWNWPPAKIFLGDVGSGFLGFWIAALAVGLHTSGILTIWTSVVLSSVFIADATVTLLRRVIRGDRWYEAHRSHAYQILARRWSSHRRVTLLLWLINLLFVLPLASLSVWRKDAAPWIAGGIVLALSLGCIGIGAGEVSKAEVGA